MITRFYIDNFKSLVNFDLELSKFTCLIGLNGAGKSTVLQALDFVSHLMIQGGVSQWLKQQGWSANDLKSNLNRRKNIKLEVRTKRFIWKATFEVETLSCIDEGLTGAFPNDVFHSNGTEYWMSTCKLHGGLNLEMQSILLKESERHKTGFRDINFMYEGSVLSQLSNQAMNGCTQEFKQSLLNLRSFGSFSPEVLRRESNQNVRNDKGDIGIEGELLAKFIRELSVENKAKLLTELQNYYPQVTKINTYLNRATETIELEVVERHGNKTLKTKARHLNDGMLRMLAVLAEQFSPLETLLFDEIENGINPEIIEKVVDDLVASPKQIIVTTHSPMLLNYMTDEVAKQSVMLIYKNKKGATHATRFFALPTAKHKLESLAPGDAMLDVYLENIAQEAEASHAE